MDHPGAQFILTLDAPEATLDRVGGKGASLAQLAAFQLPVPPGFFVTTEAYRRFVEVNDLQVPTTVLLGEIPESDPVGLEQIAGEIRARFEQATIPAEVAREITAAYAGLAAAWPASLGVCRGEPAVAVRSSATSEDLPGLSFAGQQATYLNVRGEAAVLEAIRRCWASLWTARAIAYRRRVVIDDLSAAMGLVVQVFVPAEVAGVFFTANPATGDQTEIVVNASFGLGEAIVSGTVTPDTYVLDKESGDTKLVTLGPKVTMVVPSDGQGTIAGAVPEDRRHQPVLSDHLLRELATIGLWVEHIYGCVPQDVEWAVVGGQCWLLQSRPITSKLLARSSEVDQPAAPAGSADPLLRGLPVSRGRVTAPASVVLTPADSGTMVPGTILVCPAVSPDWTALFGWARGVVTDVGGALAHAAIVAREREIPAVVGVGNATERIRHGQVVTVDGDAGTVTLHDADA